MKTYIAPTSAVLSMNVNENIAASSVNISETFKVNFTTGKIVNSDFTYTEGMDGSGLITNWLLGVKDSLGGQYASEQERFIYNDCKL